MFQLHAWRRARLHLLMSAATVAMAACGGADPGTTQAAGPASSPPTSSPASTSPPAPPTSSPTPAPAPAPSPSPTPAPSPAPSPTPSPSPAPSPAPSTSATLRWDAVANVSGYRVYHGTSSGQYLQAKGSGIPVGDATSFVVEGLTSGANYFAVTSVDASGGESDYSEEAFKPIP